MTTHILAAILDLAAILNVWWPFKSKNNHSNVISVPKLVENEVLGLHWILGLLCQQ